MKFINDAKLRAGQVLREWKEKREEEKAQKQAAATLNSDHGHGRFFLLTVPATATIFAAIVEVYWAFLFCIEATGHVLLDWSTAIGSNVPAAGEWHFAFTINSVMVLIGLACATVPIVMISMVWLPVQFTMRGTGRWRRGTMIFCGLLANLLVIISGTVVMNGNRQEQVREAVVTEQTAAQGRAAIDARLAFEQEQLRLALSNSNPYLNQAANVGAAEWERSYVAQARATNDPRLPQLERALGAARAADERRANIEHLTIERATAAPEAATASNVEDTAGRELNAFAQAVEVWRPPFVALICTLVGIFGAWWTLAIMQGLNPRDVMRSGWADEGHRIEDLRHEAPIAREPMEKPREAVFDADSGEELVPVRATWRKKPKRKGERGQMEASSDSPLTERNSSEDGGNRTASSGVTLGGRMESAGVLVGAAPDENENEHRDETEVRLDRGEFAKSEQPEVNGADEHHASNGAGEDGQLSERGNGSDESASFVDQSEPPIDFEELAAQVEEKVNEAVAVDTTPAGSAAEESLPAEYEEAPDELAATTSDTHHEPQPEQREDRLLAPPSVAAE